MVLGKNTEVLRLLFGLTFILAHITVGKEHDGEKVIGCYEGHQGMPIKKKSTLMSSKQTSSSCKVFIKVPMNRTVRIRFKCSDKKNADFEKKCIQHLSASVYHYGKWKKMLDDEFSPFEARGNLCIDSKDVMIRLDTDIALYKRKFKVIYEIKALDCHSEGTRREESIAEHYTTLTTLTPTHDHKKMLSVKSSVKGINTNRSEWPLTTRRLTRTILSSLPTSLSTTSIISSLPATPYTGSRGQGDFQTVAEAIISTASHNVADSEESSLVHSPLVVLTTARLLGIPNVMPSETNIRKESNDNFNALQQKETQVLNSFKNLAADSKGKITAVSIRTTKFILESTSTYDFSQEQGKNLFVTKKHNQLKLSTLELNSSIQKAAISISVTNSLSKTSKDIKTKEYSKIYEASKTYGLKSSTQDPRVMLKETPALKTVRRFTETSITDLDKEVLVRGDQQYSDRSSTESMQFVSNGYSQSFSEGIDSKNEAMAISQFTKHNAPIRSRAMASKDVSKEIEGQIGQTSFITSKEQITKAAPQSLYGLETQKLIGDITVSETKKVFLVSSSNSLFVSNPTLSPSSSLKISGDKIKFTKSYSKRNDLLLLHSRKDRMINSRGYSMAGMKSQKENNIKSKTVIDSVRLQSSRTPATQTEVTQERNEEDMKYYSTRSWSIATKVRKSMPSYNASKSKFSKYQSSNMSLIPTSSSTWMMPSQTQQLIGPLISATYKPCAEVSKLDYTKLRSVTEHPYLMPQERERVQHFTRLSITSQDSMALSSNQYVTPTMISSGVHSASRRHLNARFSKIWKLYNISLHSKRTSALSFPMQTPSNGNKDKKTLSPFFPATDSSFFEVTSITRIASSFGGQNVKQSTDSKTVEPTQYRSLKDAAVFVLHQITSSLLGLLNPKQYKKGNERSESTKMSHSSIMRYRDVLPDQGRNTENRKQGHDFPPGYDSFISSIHPSLSLQQYSKETIASTYLDLNKDASTLKIVQRTLHTPVRSNITVLKNTLKSSIKSFTGLYSNSLRPSKSSYYDRKSIFYFNQISDRCSYHFIKNIKEMENNDDWKFEVLDIMSLKIKRIIAVRWPYDGYLGRAGFFNRGLIVQTMDGRLWYNHFQSRGDQIYVVYLNALSDLHRGIQIIHSQNMDGDETLGEHTEAWGGSVGIYFKTCNGNQ